jgi:hypothetical protein
MKCGDGVEPYDVSSFAMDRDGHILFFSEDHPKGRKTDKYCIDNFVDNETIVSDSNMYLKYCPNDLISLFK